MLPCMNMCISIGKVYLYSCVGQRFLSPEICLWRSLGVANLQRELDRITHYRDSLQRDFIYIISPLPPPPPSHTLSSYFSLKLSSSTKIMLKVFLGGVKNAVFNIPSVPLFMVLKRWESVSSPVSLRGPETLKLKSLLNLCPCLCLTFLRNQRHVINHSQSTAPIPSPHLVPFHQEPSRVWLVHWRSRRVSRLWWRRIFGSLWKVIPLCPTALTVTLN